MFKKSDQHLQKTSTFKETLKNLKSLGLKMNFLQLSAFAMAIEAKGYLLTKKKEG